MLICPKCNSGNIVPDRWSETGQRCLMCGTARGFIERERERERESKKHAGSTLP